MSNEALGRVLARFVKEDTDGYHGGFVQWADGALTIDATIYVIDPEEIAALDQLFDKS